MNFRSRDDQPETIFKRNKVKVILLLNLAIFFTADLVAGSFLIPRDYLKALYPHSVYHHTLRPKISAITTFGSNQSYRRITNSLGMRDAAIREVALHPDRRRVLFIGDSFTEGFGVSWEDSFVGRIATALDPASVEILNGGTSGHCPKLYYLKTKYLLEVVGLEFQELIIMLDSSDIPEELIYEDYNPHTPSRAGRFFYQVGRTLRKHSYLAFSLDRVIRLRGKAALPIDLRSKEYNDAVFGFWTVQRELLDAYGIKGLKLAEANMQKLVDLCRKRNIVLKLVVFPNANQVLVHDIDSLQARYWSAFAAKNALPFLNLFPVFITDPKEDLVMIEEPDMQYLYPRYYIPRDVHWNSEGHRIAAENLSKFLTPPVTAD